MNPEQNLLECRTCGESEPSFIHTVCKNHATGRLCTDCLLKESPITFCSVCRTVYDADTSPESQIRCSKCPFIAHRQCSYSFSSSAASSSSSVPSFTCPICSDPDFTFFPKYNLPIGDDSDDDESGMDSDDDDDDDSGTLITLESAKALVAAAKIAVASMEKEESRLKELTDDKIVDFRNAKMVVGCSLKKLEQLVLKQNAIDNISPGKRKNSDR